MLTSGRTRVALLVFAGGVLGLSAAAQSRIGAPTPQPSPGQTTPGQPAPGAQTPPGASTPPQGARAIPIEPGPYVTRTAPKDWNLDIRLRVNSRRPDRVNANGMPMDNQFSFKLTALLFPQVLRSASHELNDRAMTGELRINDRVVFELDPSKKILMSGVFHSGTNLLKFEYASPDGKELTATEVTMNLKLPVTCFQTKLDEKAAMKVGWPTGDWPDAAKKTFDRQLFLDKDEQGDCDMQDLQAAVKRWLTSAGVSDPKQQPPLRIAKVITGGVVSDFQPSGDGRLYARTGEFEGFEIRTPAEIVRAKKGNEVEVVKILVLALREAGLPARVVIGQEAVEGGDSDKNFLTKKSGGKELRVWAEFCLYDEVRNTVNWVPIDVIQLRKSSSRPPSLDREWRYFGTNDQLNSVVPFAFTFHPPIPAVRAYGAPAFYGWIMQPTSPTTAYQMLNFSTSRQSKTAAPKGGGKDDQRPAEVKRGNR
jgi:hypothetical protein